MSNICKTVTLRTRKIKGGEQLSFYLDYYPGYRDESTMKVMRHESLGIYIYAKPKNQRERDYNERMREKAEALRCRRYENRGENVGSTSASQSFACQGESRNCPLIRSMPSIVHWDFFLSNQHTTN